MTNMIIDPTDSALVGFYSAKYFPRAGKIAEHTKRSVKMQFFQRKENTVLCGIDIAIALLDGVEGRDQLTIKALDEGDIIQPWEPVLTIEGPYYLFAHLESPLLGLLARPTRVATNTRRVVEAANGKPVFMFCDRFDIPEAQVYDGYATAIGGATAVCTDAMESGTISAEISLPAIGTMPHALIAYFGGDVVEACRAFRGEFPEVPLHALVDFNNDCVTDSLRCLAEFGEDLKGVRLDTAGTLVDKSLAEWETGIDNEDRLFRGVNKFLVEKVREALDANGGKHVQITVSGGFTAEKIAAFERDSVPVSNYAVGSSLLKDQIDFTADLVRPVAKVGREEKDDSRLVVV